MGGAFIAGAVAILSPGLALLLPGYAAFMAARSVHQTAKRSLIASAAGFIAGFSLVFIGLGMSASEPGQYLLARLGFFSNIAGIVLVGLGLVTIGAASAGRLLPIRVQGLVEPWGFLVAVVAGVSFAFGWTPTVSPALAAVLLAAAQPDTIGQGLVQLTSYALGLGMPLLLIALAVHLGVGRMRGYDRAIEIVSGAMIVATGVLIFTNR